MFIAQRIIRSKGSKVAKLVGGTILVNTLTDLRERSTRSKKVYVYIDSDGNEGTMRSGRKMRPVDLNVRNTVATLSS